MVKLTKPTVGVTLLTALIAMAIAHAVAVSGPKANVKPVVPDIGTVVGALGGAGGPQASLPTTVVSELASIGLPGTATLKSVKALSDDGWDIYLTPAAEGLCASLADPKGGATVVCQSTDAVESRMASPATVMTGCTQRSLTSPSVCKGALLWGVVVDGVNEVTVEVAKGKAVTTDVIDNAYLVRVALDQKPQSMLLSGGQGAGRVPVSLLDGTE